ncbi:hypothetical protein [Arcticibacter eurypsychrophilus]|uniref:hypothetical protein n=1 Tax=Arcticibacter eurypsychrophilus TaxID=1434752 RepID=UPI00084D4EC2|nr:hypothetical protein [Arcticibacter eurypsychrophilus]
MRYSLRYVLTLIITLTIVSPAWSQYEGLMYGEIVLKDKTSLVGSIRWSGGQMLWTDILLVSKANPNVIKYLNKEQLSELSDKKVTTGLDWQFMSLWKDKLPERQKEILCRFGDIASVHVTGSTQAQLYFKSGNKLRVATNDNENRHLGKDIYIYDQFLRKIKWSNISWINFKRTPENFKPFNGKPLYGTIKTSGGTLKGFIQWDKNKFLSTQKIKGETNTLNERLAYKFETLTGIEKRDKGALIKFITDKKVFLKNNRDVNSTNRGIVVMNPVWGRAIVSWESFQCIVFTPVPDNLGYQSYLKPKRIYATVSTTDNKLFKGNCSFDLDEEWDMELLEGSSNGIKYQIPFKHISSIEVLNKDQSKVILKDKRIMIMSNHNDITDKNWGIIIWLANSKYQYIPWNNVNKIAFR